MDDSPDLEGRAVVSDIEDSRIIYSPNNRNLGGAGNLDRAFNPKALIGGAWSCVLEDDNWFLPTYLIENISLLNRQSVNILLRNQEVWVESTDVSRYAGRTTKGKWFEEKVYAPHELHARLFFNEGISNGGLFWSTAIKSSFQVGPQVADTGLQEYCRTLQINEPIYFASKPLCVWSELPADMVVRSFVSNRTFGRGIQSITKYLIKLYHALIIKEATKLAERLGLETELEYRLLEALYINHRFQYVGKATQVKILLKAYIKFRLVKNPLEDYLRTRYSLLPTSN